jgi:hypothetical protein
MSSPSCYRPASCHARAAVRRLHADQRRLDARTQRRPLDPVRDGDPGRQHPSPNAGWWNSSSTPSDCKQEVAGSLRRGTRTSLAPCQQSRSARPVADHAPPAASPTSPTHFAFNAMESRRQHTGSPKPTQLDGLGPPRSSRKCGAAAPPRCACKPRRRTGEVRRSRSLL